MYVEDTTKPIISLNGNNTVFVEEGSSYTDAGATATDTVDGTLTVTTTNPVNVNAVDIYTVRYNVADAEGNQATEVTRTVYVYKKPEITPRSDGSDVTDGYTQYLEFTGSMKLLYLQIIMGMHAYMSQVLQHLIQIFLLLLHWKKSLRTYIIDYLIITQELNQE